jgi:uncharacterized protein
MIERLPLVIDPLRLAEAGSRFQGPLPLAEFQRLAPSLQQAQGEVEVEVEFGKDDLHIAYLSGRLHTQLMLVCQRCLQPMTWPVNSTFALGLVTTDQAAEQLPERYEPLMVSGSMALAEIIEDELILAVPLVPMHPRAECPAPSAGDDRQQQEAHPFAALVRLKRR